MISPSVSSSIQDPVNIQTGFVDLPLTGLLLHVCPPLGNGYHKRIPLRVWRDNRLHLQHRPAQAGPDYQGVESPQAQQPSR